MAKNEQLVVGLDIGTTKICCLIGLMRDMEVDIIGIGTHASRGLRKGVVVNIESTVESIKSAVEEAELMAGMEVDSVYVGVAGGHIKGLNSRGMIAVKNKEVSQGDIDRVVDAAKTVHIPIDREVLHVLPQEFILDDQDGIKEPLGMSGVRLEAKVHIITGAVTSAQNIVRSVNRAGLQVKDMVVEQLASAYSVLEREERELGVGLVDIGGGTCDLTIFCEDAVRHTSVLTLGGNHITNDIAIGLRTPTGDAEKIKRMNGCAMAKLVRDAETIEVPSVGGREPRVLSRRMLAEIIEPRVEEIYTLLKQEILMAGFEDLVASGLVITGGAACMEGMTELAEEVFGLPVRVGYPKGVGGLTNVVSSPQYATAVGLLNYGMMRQNGLGEPVGAGSGIFSKMFYRVKDLAASYF